jgi:hypothetical protein
MAGDVTRVAGMQARDKPQQSGSAGQRPEHLKVEEYCEREVFPSTMYGPWLQYKSARQPDKSVQTIPSRRPTSEGSPDDTTMSLTYITLCAWSPPKRS